MKDNREFDLLSDLARLIKKYGPQAFEDLAYKLNDPNFTRRLGEVLQTAATVARTTRRAAGKRPSSPREPDFRSSLFNLFPDGEKNDLLMDLYEGLKSKTLLPTLREMQSFVSDNGLPPLRSNSREKALVPFVKSFFPMPLRDVRQYLKRIQSTASEDRGLEGWSDIIFGDKKEASQRR